MNHVQTECLESVLEYRQNELFRSVLTIERTKELDKVTKLNEINKKRAEYRALQEQLMQINQEVERIRALRTNSTVERDIAKAYKKAFKHEFLTQASMYPESLEELMANVSEVIPNPGVNIETYIRALWYHGYFGFCDIMDENSGIFLSLKAKRYLENEANISLKR